MKIEFTIHGSPHGKGRPQFSTYGGRITARTPEKTVIYENLVRLEYQEQCDGKRFPDDATLKVEITAFYDIPKSMSKKKRQLIMEDKLRPTKKPDCDNVIKSILDALNQIAYRDDAQVVDVAVHKYYSDWPRVFVQIENIE